MTLELKIYAVLLLLFLIYFIYLFITNRAKAISLVKDAVHLAELYFHTESGKRKKAEAIADVFTQVAKFPPFTRAIVELFLKYFLDKYIEKEIPKVNETTKKAVQEVGKAIAVGVIDKVAGEVLDLSVDGNKELSHNTDVIDLADRLKIQAEDRAFLVGKAYVKGNTAREGVDYGAELAGGIKFR